MTDLLALLLIAVYLAHIACVACGLDDLAATARYIRRCERWVAAQSQIGETE